MKIAKALRNSFLVKKIRNRISNYPSVQAFPRYKIISKFKAYLREYLSTISSMLAADWNLRHHLSKELRRQKNAKSSRNLLILGGGPSSKNINLLQILHFQQNGGEVIMLNDFFLMSVAQEISPNYYLLVDPEYWGSNLGVIEGYKKVKLLNYLEKRSTSVVQPAKLPRFSENNHTLFLNPTHVPGFKSKINPVGFWGHPNTVSLYALALGRYMGYTRVFFAGLDSSSYRHFQVNDLNEVYLHMDESHAYSEEIKKLFAPDRELVNEFPLNPSQKTIQDVLYSEALYRKSFMKLAGEAINVGGDNYNDLCPRASLIPQFTPKSKFPSSQNGV